MNSKARKLFPWNLKWLFLLLPVRAYFTPADLVLGVMSSKGKERERGNGYTHVTFRHLNTKGLINGSKVLDLKSLAWHFFSTSEIFPQTDSVDWSSYFSSLFSSLFFPNFIKVEFYSFCFYHHQCLCWEQFSSDILLLLFFFFPSFQESTHQCTMLSSRKWN